jgi:hypothetical protein
MQNDSFLEESSGGSGGALQFAMNKAAALDEEAREESHSPKTVLVDLEKPQNCHHLFGLKNLSRSSSENSTFGNYPLIIKSLDDVIDSAEYLNEDAFQNCDFEYNLDVNFLNYHKYQEAAAMQASEHHHHQYYSSNNYHQAGSTYSYDAHSLAQHMQVPHLKGKAIDAASTMDYHHGTAIAYPSKVGYSQDDFGTALFPQHFQENCYIGEGKVASYPPAAAFSSGCAKKTKSSKRKSSSAAAKTQRSTSLLGGETRTTAAKHVKPRHMPLAKKSKVLQSQPGGTASIRSNTTTTTTATATGGSKSARANCNSPSSKKKRTSFPRNTTKALKEWLRRNILNPYPSEEEKKKLCREFDLTCPQLQTWFINARIRLWKPCIEHIYNSQKHQLKRMEASSSSSENPPNHSPNYLGSPDNNLVKREIIPGSSNNNGNGNGNSVSGAMKMISKLRAIPDLEIKIESQVEKFMASM